MTCENCDPAIYFSGRLVKVSPDFQFCAMCGELLSPELKSIKGVQPYPIKPNIWDQYFHRICEAVASKSPCLSRKIGAILVKDHSIVSTGFNGPSRGIPHCGRDRMLSDVDLGSHLLSIVNRTTRSLIDTDCPRRILGYESGTHMELCPAVHAEANAVIDAARKGTSTIGTTLYMNCIIPCKNCFSLLINAGIVSIVVDDTKVYDRHTQYLIDNSKINIRRFEI
jgi:dCMP deaminase